MSKELCEMTLEELWKLFPIKLEDHNENWSVWYDAEKINIENMVGKHRVRRISHIGSTAINGIKAKPIIDILLEVDSINFYIVYKKIKKSNWLCMREEDGKMAFNKGYKIHGYEQKVFHLHLRKSGDCEELYFRDYLNDNADIAQKYEDLKVNLCKIFENNRDAYTAAKTEFVKQYTDLAVQLYPGRY